MSERIVVSAVGAAIEIDASGADAALHRRIRDAWTDALLPRTAVADATVALRPRGDERTQLSHLSTDVTLAALAHRRGDLWMLHAAGLADERGRVLVLAAPSGTGKTTVSRHLSARYAYVSDETVGIAADGGIVSYRKPLSIIEEGLASKTQTAPSAFERAPWPQHPLRLARIAVLDRDPDMDAVPVVTALDTAEALEALTPQTSYLCDMSAPLHFLDALLAATGGAVRIRFRDAVDLDEVIRDLIDAEPPEGLDASAAGVAPAAAVTGPGYRCGDVVDALDLADGRLATLQRADTGGQLTVLDGIAPAIWRAAGGASLDELTAAVLDAAGEPPDGVDARTLVETAVAELTAKRLLASGAAD